jgi:hypothetical protein
MARQLLLLLLLVNGSGCLTTKALFFSRDREFDATVVAVTALPALGTATLAGASTFALLTAIDRSSDSHVTEDPDGAMVTVASGAFLGFALLFELVDAALAKLVYQIKDWIHGRWSRKRKANLDRVIRNLYG